MSEMEVDQSPTTAATTIATSVVPSVAAPAPVDMNILDSVKLLQYQHGLRHGDYLRYRQYCSRRLHRLYNSLRISHGRNKYIRHKLEPRHITRADYLFVPLVNAERCWSYAMQLKQGKPSPSQRRHLVRKLAKAARWSQLLENLAKERGNDQTSLEAQAYSSWMKGNFCLEKKLYQEARAEYIKSRTIYDNLSKIGDAKKQSLFKQKVSEIDPNIRYCSYQLDEETDVGSLLSIQFKDDPSFLQLREKIETLAQNTAHLAANALKEVSWHGRTIPIRSDKVKDLLTEAEQFVGRLSTTQSADEKSAVFDQVLLCYNDITKTIKEQGFEQTKGKASKAELDTEQRLLLSYVQFQYISKTVERNEMLIESMQEKQEGRKEKKIIYLYDTVLRSLHSLLEIPEVSELPDELLVIGSKIELSKAARCYLLASSYQSSGKYSEATTLFTRTIDYCQKATAQLQGSPTPNQDQLRITEQWRKKAKIGILQARALAFQQQVEQEEKLKESVSSLSIHTKETAQAVSILSRLDSITPVLQNDSPFLVSFPPTLERIPCKPVFFDLAYDEVHFPSIDHRLPKATPPSTTASAASTSQHQPAKQQLQAQKKSQTVTASQDTKEEPTQQAAQSGSSGFFSFLWRS